MNQIKRGVEHIDQSDIIHFPQGIPGFEDIKDYVLYADEDVPFIMTLQSTTTEHPSFVVVDPYCVLKDYKPILSEADKKFFKIGHTEELKFLLVAILTDNIQDSVINLKSPIAIHPEKNRAKQVILENGDYPIRFHLFGQTE
ncbi:MAG TPA: flagellar assembly protein FliW [Clostridiales bacterium]|nr:flagellar assembly protein FliW [Clostridiales bacterium]